MFFSLTVKLLSFSFQTILDDCSEVGSTSQKSKGNGSGGSLSNSCPTYSLGNQQTEANATCVSSTVLSQAVCLSPLSFNSSSPGQSHNARSSVPIQGVTQCVRQGVTQGVTQCVTVGSQILMQSTARTTAQLGSTTSTLQLHASSQCSVDRPVPVIQPMATQQSGCSVEGRLLPIPDMDWVKNVL